MKLLYSGFIMQVEDIGIDASDPPSVDDFKISQLGSKSSHSKSGTEM